MKIDITRVITIDSLIAQKSTGTPDALARQLNISKRSLFGNLNFMRTSLKAPIVYSKGKATYIYAEEGVFLFTFLKDKKGAIRKAIIEATRGLGIVLFLANLDVSEFVNFLNF